MDSGDTQNGATIGKFKHFDVVPLAEDHHYLQSDNKPKKCFCDSNASVYAQIMKEWRILDKSLPESIYVRAYETRIDLLRAVIIGPAGTPYHDGLFFFDIAVPSDYPKSPPKVFYHSHGYRLNPNLYANGKVCLSLINTWSGSKDEKWSKKSTILQVLVSIQGLVLNERPYFNEPGYTKALKSKEPRWINASICYNEDVFLLSCKTMLQTIRKPPMNFEEFVVKHFRGRAGFILAAVQQYQQGRVLVGQFQMNAASSSSFLVSSKFMPKLASIHPMLRQAFASVNNEPNKALVGTSKKVKSQGNVEEQKTGFLSKFISFAKKIWK